MATNRSSRRVTRHFTVATDVTVADYWNMRLGR
jgi:transcriptional regulator GlxA family with amidase domain